MDDRGQLQPMFGFGDVFTEWLADFDRIRTGNLTDIDGWAPSFVMTGGKMAAGIEVPAMLADQKAP